MEVTTVPSPDGTGEYFNVLDVSLRFVYGKQLTDRLRVGGSVKYIREEIYTMHMQSFLVDIGSNFDTGIYGLMLGMSVFFAIKDAIASVGDYNTTPIITAPATPEKILMSIKNLKSKI